MTETCKSKLPINAFELRNEITWLTTDCISTKLLLKTCFLPSSGIGEMRISQKWLAIHSELHLKYDLCTSAYRNTRLWENGISTTSNRIHMFTCNKTHERTLFLPSLFTGNTIMEKHSSKCSKRRSFALSS